MSHRIIYNIVYINVRTVLYYLIHYLKWLFCYILKRCGSLFNYLFTLLSFQVIIFISSDVLIKIYSNNYMRQASCRRRCKQADTCKIKNGYYKWTSGTSRSLRPFRCTARTCLRLRTASERLAQQQTITKNNNNIMYI